MIRLGLIGCGAVVHNTYAPVLVGRDAYRVTHVHDLDDTQARSAAQLYGAQATPLDDLLEAVDAVIVTTPPGPRPELVRAALAENRIVLCEKPFMPSAADAVAAVQEAETTRTRLYVSHFRREFPNVALARDIVSVGTLGEITHITAHEGGRFTWRAVSQYTTKDPRGGVAWDTGAHTLDMALFVSGLDERDFTVGDVSVARDRPEPSHEIDAGFTLRTDDRDVSLRLALSRKRVLPNFVRIRGERGELVFLSSMDDRIRVTGRDSSVVLVSERRHQNMLECFDLQFRSIFGGDGADRYSAGRFVGQIRILEALSDA